MVQYLLYPVTGLILYSFMFLVIPRDKVRTLLPIGIVFGGLLDIVITILMQNIFGLVHYTNIGEFSNAIQMFFSPIAWASIICIFLYFNPNHQLLRYLYISAWAILAVAFGHLVQNVGLFEYLVSWLFPIPKLLLYIGWFSLANWVYYSLTPTAAPVDADL